jgi:Flp pilus assembly protein TadD
VLREGLKTSVEGSEESAKLHLLLGTVYQQQRKYDEAVSEFRGALEIQPGLREAMFSLGWTYALTGNKEEGHRFLKKFVDVAGPETPAHYVQAARDRMNELGDGP